MHKAYIALGSNLGDRESSLQEALRRLSADPSLHVRELSQVYETAPVGYTDQPAFLNMTAGVETEKPPLALLRSLLEIEQAMGRVREFRNGPRNIDLDLLVVDDIEMNTPELVLPHPRMGQRAFVLTPLRDIWPEEKRFPWDRELAAMSLAEEGVTLWATWDGSGPGKEM